MWQQSWLQNHTNSELMQIQHILMLISLWLWYLSCKHQKHSISILVQCTYILDWKFTHRQTESANRAMKPREYHESWFWCAFINKLHQVALECPCWTHRMCERHSCQNNSLASINVMWFTNDCLHHTFVTSSTPVLWWWWWNWCSSKNRYLTTQSNTNVRSTKPAPPNWWYSFSKTSLISNEFPFDPDSKATVEMDERLIK